MKCGDKEWMHCRVEKMGCKGCHYDKFNNLEIANEFANLTFIYGGKIVLTSEQLKKYQKAIRKLIERNEELEENRKLIGNDIENFKAQAYMLGRSDENEAMKGVIERHYISRDKIKKDLETCEKVYKREMKPYQREYGLDVTYLSKKEKEKLINTRNCLITQMETYKQLLGRMEDE